LPPASWTWRLLATSADSGANSPPASALTASIAPRLSWPPVTASAPIVRMPIGARLSRARRTVSTPAVSVPRSSEALSWAA
jgi:hypothetical protein